jgi:hypothetical protein
MRRQTWAFQVSTQKRLVKAMFVIWHGVVSRWVTTPPASPTAQHARPCSAACKHDLTNGKQQRAAADAVALLCTRSLACTRAGGLRRCVACMHACMHASTHACTHARMLACMHPRAGEDARPHACASTCAHACSRFRTRATPAQERLSACMLAHGHVHACMGGGLR